LVLSAAKRSVPARRLLYLAGAFLLIAMPTTVPLILNLWEVPPLSFVRFPGKMMQIVWPLIALLAVLGVDQVESSRRTVISALLIFAILAVVLLLLPQEIRLSLVSLLGGQQSYAILSTFWNPSLICALSFLFVAVVAIAISKKNAAIFLAVLAIVESGYLAQSSFDVVTLPNETVASQIDDLAGKRHSRISVYVSSGNSVLDSISARDIRARYIEASGGGASLWGYGLATEQSFTGIQLKGIQQLDDTLFENLPGRMRAFGTDYLLIGQNIQVSEALVSVASWPDAGLELYKLREGVKKLFYANRLIIAETENDFAQLVNVYQDRLDQTAIVRHQLALSDAPEVTIDDISERSSKSLKFKTTSDKPALIWSADAIGPGWSVTVNNVKAEPIMVQGAFRGVVVPAGQSSVVWKYRSTSLWIALAISACLLLLLSVFSTTWRRNTHLGVEIEVPNFK